MSSSTLPVRDITPAPRGFTCPMGANCSCVFSRNTTSEAELTEVVAASGPRPKKVAKRLAREVKHWTDLGWKVTSANPREVILERRRGIPFCANVLLCLATAFLWLAYWIPNARHPKIDTRIVSVSDAGEILTSPALTRR